MAKSNRDRVSDILYALKEGLGVFILREFKMVYKAQGYLREVEETLRSVAYDPPYMVNEANALDGIDAHGWLKLMWAKWNDVFKTKLGQSERNYVSELMTARNDWAHQKAFTNEDAHRTADTATRLLEAVGATAQAQVTRGIAQELLRLRFDG